MGEDAFDLYRRKKEGKEGKLRSKNCVLSFQNEITTRIN